MKGSTRGGRDSTCAAARRRKTAKRVRNRRRSSELNLRANARLVAPSCETRERSRLNFSMSQFTELPLPCARTCAEGEAAMAGRSRRRLPADLAAAEKVTRLAFGISRAPTLRGSRIGVAPLAVGTVCAGASVSAHAGDRVDDVRLGILSALSLMPLAACVRVGAPTCPRGLGGSCRPGRGTCPGAARARRAPARCARRTAPRGRRR